MRFASLSVRIFGSFLISCNLLSSGCSSLIAYSGQDVGKLANKDQVHKSFGTPDNVGNEDGCEFEEFRTHRKISEPDVAAANMYLGVFELWNFPASILQTMWTTVAGQTLRFEYGSHGEVQNVLIDGTAMKYRACLP